MHGHGPWLALLARMGVHIVHGTRRDQHLIAVHAWRIHYLLLVLCIASWGSRELGAGREQARVLQAWIAGACASASVWHLPG